MIKVCVEALKNAQKDSTKVELRHMKLALCDDRKLKLFLVANDFDKIVLIGLSNLIERGDRGKDSLDDLKAITEQLARTNKIDEKVDEFHILKSLSRMETNRWISFEKYSVFKKSEDKVRKVHIKDTLVSIEIEIEDFRKDPLIDKHFSLAKPNGQTIWRLYNHLQNLDWDIHGFTVEIRGAGTFWAAIIWALFTLFEFNLDWRVLLASPRPLV